MWFKKKKEEEVTEVPYYENFEVEELIYKNGVFLMVKLIYPYGYITINDMEFTDYKDVKNYISQTIKKFGEIRKTLNIDYGLNKITYNFKTQDYVIKMEHL